MNKREIIEKVKKYNFDFSKYIVISGAAMVIRDVKEETSDIDIAVSDDYYLFLLKNYMCIFDRINQYNNKVYYIDDVINFAQSYYNCNYTIVEGIRVQELEDIKKLKENLNRKKNINDIKLLNKKMIDMKK